MEEFYQTNESKQKFTEILKVTGQLCIEWNKENIIISSKKKSQFLKKK